MAETTSTESSTWDSLSPHLGWIICVVAVLTTYTLLWLWRRGYFARNRHENRCFRCRKAIKATQPKGRDAKGDYYHYMKMENCDMRNRCFDWVFGLPKHKMPWARRVADGDEPRLEMVTKV